MAKMWYEIKVEWDNGEIETLARVKSIGLACHVLTKVREVYQHNDRAKRIFFE